MMTGKFTFDQHCINTHTALYTYVRNQQDATTFSFINLFKSALHDSGDKFAHPQEHFLTVCTAFGTMHRHCCRPVPWHQSAAVSVCCTKSCTYSQKVLLGMDEFVAWIMKGWFKKINKRKSCCILLVSYMVVLVTHRHTNIKYCLVLTSNRTYVWSKRLTQKNRKIEREVLILKFMPCYVQVNNYPSILQNKLQYSTRNTEYIRHLKGKKLTQCEIRLFLKSSKKKYLL